MKLYVLISFFSICYNTVAQVDSINCVIYGSVVDLHQQPIPEATVIVYSYINDTVTTNSDGEYCFKASPPDMYTISYHHPEYGTHKLEGMLFKRGHGYEIDTVELSEFQIELEKLYTQLVNKADELFDAKAYKEAAELYQRAYSFRPSDQHVISQIDLISSALFSFACPSDGHYNDLVEQADQYYELKIYKKANALYECALVIVPNDSHCMEMIEQIKVNLLQK